MAYKPTQESTKHFPITESRGNLICSQYNCRAYWLSIARTLGVRLVAYTDERLRSYRPRGLRIVNHSAEDDYQDKSKAHTTHEIMKFRRNTKMHCADSPKLQLSCHRQSMIKVLNAPHMHSADNFQHQYSYTENQQLSLFYTLLVLQ